MSRKIGRMFAAVVLACAAVNAGAVDSDPDSVWPLCGRISESPPSGWVATDGCPSDRFGDPAYADEPLSATFGPRPLASESNRYDFHRGVDIATPVGTPFFAIADGTVETAGPHPSFSDPLVKLRHFRPGETSCNAGGCYHSYYLHIGSWVVAQDQAVVKGQLLGYTGASGSGFEHLHFELRDAPDWDPFSAWQRDSIHPLQVLPYAAPNDTAIVFNTIDFTDPLAGIVDLTVTSKRYDLVRVALTLLDAAQQPIPQPGDTPDARGYNIEPAFFDLDAWNFQYTHKDSADFPWSSYAAGGANECPYHADHGAAYDPYVHLDQQHPLDPHDGLFNGVHVRTRKYWPSDVSDYTIDLEFLALQGTPACVQVTATFASGDTASDEWGSCGAVTQPLLVRGPYLQMQADDSILIRWRTDVPTDSVVRYGSAPDNLDQVGSVGGSRTDHEVRLSDLGTAQRYYYSVGDSLAPIAGDASYHFSTAPTPGNPADTRFWVLGDSGTANTDARAVRDAYKAYASSDPADFIIMLGDNAYNDGTDSEYQAAVFDTYPELLRQLPLVSALGNHDGHSADSGTQNGPYFAIFSLPAGGEMGGLASGTEAYYSFDFANIHFICLDSYDTSRTPGGAMLTWLESDLALNTQPWVIAYWHHPPYSKGSHNSDTEGRLIDMRQNVLPILEDWGVDLVMTGHSHSYERSYLLDGHYGGSLSLDPDGNILDPGDGHETGDGAYEKPDVIAAVRAGAVYAVAGSSGKTSGGALNHPAMFVSLNRLGSMIVDVSGNRMDLVFLDDTGTVLDEFTMLKTPDNDPPLLTAATADDATHVRVDFDEALDALEAERAANYSIAGLSVDQAVLLPGERSVRLTTSAMTPDAHYALVVNEVQDLALNTIAPGSRIEFDFVAFVTVSFQDDLMPDPGYDGTFDAYIREASPTTNYGLDSTLQVDGAEPANTTTDMSIVLGWDVSGIPANAVVEDARIELQVTNASSGSYRCFGLLMPWNQQQVTWNLASSGSAWNSPGASGAGDRGADVLCTVTAGSTGLLTVPLTAAGLAQVQAWISDPSSNHGLIISDSSNTDGADFHSSESATTMSRPKLTITYRAPAANTPPAASFAFGTTGLTADFSDTSADADGSIVAWSWDFGDGNVSSNQNPSHSYVSAGTYTVTLTVTDDAGDSDSASRLVTVEEPPAALAVYGIDPNSSPVPNTVDVTVSGSGFLAGAALTFAGGSGPSPTVANVIVVNSGTLTATVQVREGGPNRDRAWDVQVTNPGGASATLVAGFVVTVGGSPPANQPPAASFNYGTSGLTANFTDTSTDPDGTIVAWSWTFGDGNGSASQNPSHDYASAGAYTVTLTVTDDDGASGATSQTVTVADSPAGISVLGITPGTSPTPANLSVTVAGSGFASGASLSFAGGGGPTPVVTNVIVANSGTLTADVQIKDGGPPKSRQWDVIVRNPDGASAVLPQGFTVIP